MSTERSRTSRSGDSDAIRHPHDVAFGDDDGSVLARSGDVMTMYQAVTTIPAMLDRLAVLPPVPAIETRDVECLPEREGR
jgi:virulence-associated protein VagC